MKVRLLNLHRYATIQEVGDIVEAKRLFSGGYFCNVKCEYGVDKLWFPSHHVKEIDNEPQTDSIVESVINQFKQRSEAGINKYGTTLDRNDLTPLQWLTHLSEELMDATLYIEKLKQELK